LPSLRQRKARFDKDQVALAAVLDLLRFMLATGQRIGECIGVLGFEMDLEAAREGVSSTVIRWTGHGLVRKSIKSKAGSVNLRFSCLRLGVSSGSRLFARRNLA